MDETIEVVICHDILAVPYQDTTQYVWAATQTFTIKHLENTISENEGAELINCNSPVNNNLSNIDIPVEHSIIQDQNGFQNGVEKIANGDNNNIKLPELIPFDTKHDTLSESITTSNENKLDNENQFLCGVCDESFQTEMMMHSHRVVHFGYFNGSYRRPCFACNQLCSSLKDMSEHLFEHFPRTEKDREEQCRREERDRSLKKAIKTIEKPSQNRKTLENAARNTNHNQPPEINHKNYPMTNNDRLSNKLSLISQVLSQNPSISISPISKSQTNKYNSNNNNNNKFPLIIKEVQSLASKEPQRVLECGVCTSKFTVERKLHEHRLRHFGYHRLRDYRKCAFCGETFKNSFEFSEHLLEHYKEKFGVS